jgi:uncharacterized protein (TIGR02466 family)
MAMHSELWFPSVIWSAIIHCIDNVKLKTWVYERKRNDIGRTISNDGGYQSSDIAPGENSEIDSLVEYVNKEIFNCCQQVLIPDCKLYNIWLNINPPGAYNQLHNHAGAMFSGVYYVSATHNQGDILFERNDGAEYVLPSPPATPSYYNCGRAAYAAKTNALFIFPGWLKHCVTSNKTNQDRISISFNYGLK